MDTAKRVSDYPCPLCGGTVSVCWINMTERFIMCKNLDCTFPFQLPSGMLKKMFRLEKKARRSLGVEPPKPASPVVASPSTAEATAVPTDITCPKVPTVDRPLKRQKTSPAMAQALHTVATPPSRPLPCGETVMRRDSIIITAQPEETVVEKDKTILSTCRENAPQSTNPVPELPSILTSGNITPEPEAERAIDVISDCLDLVLCEDTQPNVTTSSLEEPALISPPSTATPTPLLSATISGDESMADFVLDDTITDVWSLPVTPTDKVFAAPDGHTKAGAGPITLHSDADFSSFTLESLLFDGAFDLSSITSSCQVGLEADEEFDLLLTQQIGDLS
ncbi:MAG: hypothetical protein J3Q66DRAFT_97383 [Benniella sp.]|nr:MAG: hypothetical protein J3Q66DRAFT_97383 [Benniella sp.]